MFSSKPPKFVLPPQKNLRTPFWQLSFYNIHTFFTLPWWQNTNSGEKEGRKN